jgi:hypothetical protein
VLDLVRLAVADDHVGRARDDRGDQQRDVQRGVLVVGVRVDDDVGAELQARVEARLEARGQALVVRQADDVVDAGRPGHRDGRVRGAVVDDEPLDHVEARDLARQVGERAGELLLLVPAGDLDDELHKGVRRGDPRPDPGRHTRLRAGRCRTIAAIILDAALRAPRAGIAPG